MAIVGDQTYREVIPHEPEHWIEFRDLTAFERIEARRMRQRDSIDDLRLRIQAGALAQELRQNPMTAPFLEAQVNAETERESFVVPAGPDPNDFDLFTTLHYGINAWSYDVPCTDENKRRLDEETALWARQQIIRIRLSGAPLKNV